MNEPSRTTQSSTAYRHLRRLLLYGQTPAGKRLTEAPWAEQLGITRGALREAMSMLAHEGLLTRGKKGGFFVPILTQRDIDSILEVRLAFEIAALHMMTRRGGCPQNGLQAMRRACDTMEQLMKDGYTMGFVEADYRFHLLLVEAGGNERLLQVYNQAPLPLVGWQNSSLENARQDEEQTVREHRALCDFIEAKKIDGAVALLEDHLMSKHSP